MQVEHFIGFGFDADDSDEVFFFFSCPCRQSLQLRQDERKILEGCFLQRLSLIHIYLMPNYLIFRTIIPGQPPNRETVRLLVDNFMLPGLTRGPGSHGAH